MPGSAGIPGCAVRTGRAESEAALQNAGANCFRVGEEWCDGAVTLNSGGASLEEAQFVTEGGVGAGVGDGIHDGAGDAAGEEIEKFGVEIGQGSGEGVVDFGGSEIGGSVMGVGGGEYQLMRFESLAAVDGSENFGVQAGGNGEQFGGDERQAVAAAIVEVEGAGVETGPVTASDTPGEAVATHGDAGAAG